MALRSSLALAAALATYVLPAAAQSISSCSTTLTPTKSVQPTIASGYRWALVATGLTSPRGIQFDKAGNLLVVEQDKQISNIAFKDNGGTCLEVDTITTVISNNSLNHGITLSSDGKTFYASSPESAWAWDYDDTKKSVSNPRTLVSGMNTDDHTTRTLLLSQNAPDTLLVSRGSTSNVDLEAADITTGHSQIKAFNLSNITANGYNYDTEGLRLGWGLRNSVGVAEHPETGGLYSVENSVDQIMRYGKEIHEDNPGEEMNFHGYLNGTRYASQGSNYGYPFCFAAWVVSDIPNNSNITVGSQFAIDIPSATRNDSYCDELVPPRLTFQAHMAPLDLKFNNSGTEGWVSFHGSWDRTDPVGYKVSVVTFANGSPVDPPSSKTAAVDVMTNVNNSNCPDSCFRPVGIAFDGRGRLFFSSDATGEIYVLLRDEGANATATPNGTTTSTSSGSQSSSTKSSGLNVRVGRSWPVVVNVALLAACALL